MKIIINCDDGLEVYAMSLIINNAKMFNRPNSKNGWGWHFGSKPAFFLRQIKGGISATQLKED